MKNHPLAGHLPEAAQLVNIPGLITAYYTLTPDPSVASQRVQFGTSGHRGSSLSSAFNEAHILAITQAICLYRAEQKITGPLFLGMDTHALSAPAHATALEVLAANGVTVKIAAGTAYTPTPVISHAILTFNQKEKENKADGIVITPSHNPPAEGGFKYNPPHGGPAEAAVTSWIQDKANAILAAGLKEVKRISLEKALKMAQPHDFLFAYIDDLKNVIDLETIRQADLNLGVDPLGGAGVHYWPRIAEKYGLNLTIVNQEVDPTFRFMTLDWDGQIRMDPSSSYAMQSLIGLKDRFDLAFACDTDHDRHGIVTKSHGLLSSNHYLSAALFYLFQHRPHWPRSGGIGKSIVSSQLINRISAHLKRPLDEVPVGFKWFVEGLLQASLHFVCEESAGASFSRLDGTVWTTDKDGIIASLLAAEMRARTGKDPGLLYEELTHLFGAPVFDRIDAPATPQQKAVLQKLSPEQLSLTTLGGEPIQAILSKAPGNGAPIGGIKVMAANGWFAARPSGTENIYKIYAESFLGEAHLKNILQEAQSVVDATLKGIEEICIKSCS